MTRDPRRVYRVVDDFEAELADYADARFAVAVNSCTNALFLALTWERMRGLEGGVSMPRRTYVGVLQSVLNAGFTPRWHDERWQQFGSYRLWPTDVVDSARMLKRGMYWPYWDQHDPALICISLHVAKQLPVGRGGAIITDNEEAVEWFRAARMDGRPPGSNTTVFPGWHMPMAPDVAARGLDILSRWNDAGYSPPALAFTDYPDLSLLASTNRALSNSVPSTPDRTSVSP